MGLRKKLTSGDGYVSSVVWDRGYGKLKQGIIHTGDEEGGPVKASIRVEFVNANNGRLIDDDEKG